MKNSRFFLILIIIFAMLINGCLAAVPVIWTGALAGVLGTSAINNAKDQYPNVNFDKTYPECVDYNKDYSTIYQNALQTLYDLKEQTDRTDKESGVITTQKTPFGEEPGAVSYAMGKKVFWQRKLIYVKKLSYSKSQICVKVKFSRKGSMTQETEFEDPNGENVARAIFFDKLDKLLGVTSSSSPTLPEKRTDIQQSTTKSDIKQDVKAKEQPARRINKAQEQDEAKGAESLPSTIAIVKKAKKEQGLSGYIFQDQKSQKFYLEDNEGIMYKFDGGQWKKLE